MKILVINSGSSSIKFQVMDSDTGAMLGKGLLERIGEESGVLRFEADSRSIREEQPIPDHSRGLDLLLKTITHPEYGTLASLEEIRACGHRVVHGGERFTRSVLIDEEVLRTLRECAELAPLHNPPNILGIEAAMEKLPGIPNVAVFDTAFHQTMPRVNYLYGLPYEVYEKYRIRRYGFHGTSHQYVSQRAAEMLGRPLEDLNLITCHLGNGCSVTAVRGGRSVDTSLGFGTFCGLMMGTRCGDVDPAALFELMEHHGWSLEKVKKTVYRESGLLGISGLSNDMRDIEDASFKRGEEMATLALDMFVDRVRKYIGAYAATLGRLDGIVFTAGIGENGPEIREMVCSGQETLGIRIDPEANKVRGKERIVSMPDSRVKVLVVPTNEELMIARETRRVISG
jgi:acetate kinase